MRSWLRLGFGVAVVAIQAACAPNPFCLNCDDGSSGAPDLVATITDMHGTLSEFGEPGDLDSDGGDLGSDMDVCAMDRLQVDPLNCGQCGHQCSHSHAIPKCVNGACQIDYCDVGWVDLDTDPSNDCEYQCLPSGNEVCDGADNDCDGLTDEGFDKQVDPRNCGACGVVCAFTNATPTCKAGKCAPAGCNPGFVDLDGKPDNGCEYTCPVYPPQPIEICNGIDDNCDGQIDESSHLEAPPTDLCVTRAGTPCEGTVAACEKRNGSITWYCHYGAGVEFDPALPNGIARQEQLCDGADGDCNGAADDTFVGLGRRCDNGKQGACLDIGAIICDPMDPHATVCDLSVLPDAVPGAPSTEKCNGLDDDCDGIVDNATGANRVVQEMVRVRANGLDFYIDRYEASRPDATSTSEGISSGRSCSRSGVKPWSRVSYAAAQAACAAAGFRLCSGDEWGAACASNLNHVYPYGDTYQAQACNGIDMTPAGGMNASVSTGSASACFSSDGVRDLSGNLKEWTSDARGTTTTMPPQTIYVLRGGSFATPSLGLTCGTTFSRAGGDTVLDDVGFRCCSPTAP